MAAKQTQGFHGFNLRRPCVKGAVSVADWGIAVLVTLVIRRME